MEIRFKVDFKIAEIVYIITDPDQDKCIITGYMIDDTSVMYRVCKGASTNYYYGFELSTDKTF